MLLIVIRRIKYLGNVVRRAFSTITKRSNRVVTLTVGLKTALSHLVGAQPFWRNTLQGLWL